MRTNGDGPDYNNDRMHRAGREPELYRPAVQRTLPPSRLFNHRIRLIIIAIVIFAWAGVILSRLAQTQWQRAGELKEKAQRQYQHQITLTPKRGTIYDRHGRPLAINVDAPSVYAVPEEVEDPVAAAEELSRPLEIPAGELEELLRRDRSFVWLKRKITPAQKEEITSLKIRGIHFVTESKRIYPAGRLACHVLGFAGVDNDGLAGLEHKYDSYLRGKTGLMIGIRGAKQGYLFSAGKVIKNPTGGYDLTLTIDSRIQFIVEEELQAAVESTNSISGTVVVMEPATGAILAMAGFPDYDPNDFANARPFEIRNRAVMDAYEPGSTFKLVTAAAALETGLVKMDQTFDCGNGQISLNGHTINDHRPFGNLSFRAVIEHSSNIGAIRVGIKVGKKKLRSMAVRLGYGSGTGIDLPAENPGLLRPINLWSEISIGSISIGQEVSANPVQILTTAATIANGGYRVRPYVVNSIQGPGGNEIYRNKATGKRVLNEATLARLQELGLGVVSRGSGKEAAIPGVLVAGKTGTAEKADPGEGYIPGAYVASFIGYFPADETRIAMICLLNEPQGEYYGGIVAAPLFSSIGARIVRELEIVPESRDIISRRLTAAVTQDGIEEEDSQKRPVKRTLKKLKAALVMPDVRGLSIREAVARLAELGVVPIVKGSGKIVRQSPTPGEPVGGETILYCGGAVFAGENKYETGETEERDRGNVGQR